MTLKRLDHIFEITHEEPEVERDEHVFKSQAKSLTRFEFWEIIARVAFEKYVVSGKVKDTSRALIRLLNNHILPVMRDENLPRW